MRRGRGNTKQQCRDERERSHQSRDRDEQQRIRRSAAYGRQRTAPPESPSLQRTQQPLMHDAVAAAQREQCAGGQAPAVTHIQIAARKGDATGQQQYRDTGHPQERHRTRASQHKPISAYRGMPQGRHRRGLWHAIGAQQKARLAAGFTYTDEAFEAAVVKSQAKDQVVQRSWTIAQITPAPLPPNSASAALRIRSACGCRWPRLRGTTAAAQPVRIRACAVPSTRRVVRDIH